MGDSISDPWLWFLARGAGFIALWLLTVSVVLGIGEAGRWRSRVIPRFVGAELHRNISLLAIVLVVVHVVTVELHVGEHVAWTDAVIPFESRFRPPWVGLGTIAFDVTIALAVTSGLRRFIGARAWRAFHWTAYGAWVMAVAHSLGTGTDTQARWSVYSTAACAAAVLLALVFRIASGRSWGLRVRIGAILVTVVVAALLGRWATAGPLAPGWAQPARTPTPQIHPRLGRYDRVLIPSHRPFLM